jgi:hypothetical protein
VWIKAAISIWYCTTQLHITYLWLSLIPVILRATRVCKTAFNFKSLYKSHYMFQSNNHHHHQTFQIVDENCQAAVQ